MHEDKVIKRQKKKNRITKPCTDGLYLYLKKNAIQQNFSHADKVSGLSVNSSFSKNIKKLPPQSKECGSEKAKIVE